MSNPQSQGRWDDGDSGIHVDTDGPESSFTSVASSIYDHVEENGRTYHRYKNGKYALPNDRKEQNRLDYQHVMFEMLFDGKLVLAPIDDMPLHNVLDVATGTGAWAIEFADSYPDVMVVGSDLSPIQPDYAPPNCSFTIDDAEDEWAYHHSFEYIHLRGVVTCFENGKGVIKSAFESLSPGGYLEIQDAVFPICWEEPPPADSQFVLWNRLSIEAAASAGRPWTNTPKYAGWMREIGFEDVVVRRFVVPCGPWLEGAKEKRLGEWVLGNWMQALEAMTTRNLSRIGWSVESSLELVAKVKSELTSGTMKPYTEILAIYGRKPKLASGEGGAPEIPDTTAGHDS